MIGIYIVIRVCSRYASSIYAHTTIHEPPACKWRGEQPSDVFGFHIIYLHIIIIILWFLFVRRQNFFTNETVPPRGQYNESASVRIFYFTKIPNYEHTTERNEVFQFFFPHRYSYYIIFQPFIT